MRPEIKVEDLLKTLDPDVEFVIQDRETGNEVRRDYKINIQNAVTLGKNVYLVSWNSALDELWILVV